MLPPSKQTTTAGAAAIVVMLASSWIACGGQEGPETTADSEEPTSIVELGVSGLEGFDSIPWGTTDHEIIRRQGIPDRLEQISILDSVSELEYFIEIAGYEGIKTFEVHDRHGLISGSFAVPVTDPRRCHEAMRAMMNRMGTRYSAPMPGPEQKANFDPCTLPFQAAAIEDFRLWQVVWMDSVAEARAMLTVDWFGPRGGTDVELSMIHALHDSVYGPYLDSIAANLGSDSQG